MQWSVRYLSHIKGNLCFFGQNTIFLLNVSQDNDLVVAALFFSNLARFDSFVLQSFAWMAAREHRSKYYLCPTELSNDVKLQRYLILAY